jgi:signal transduction histidine kinase/uncharacterized membrane protein YhdT
MTFWAIVALFNLISSGFLGILVYLRDRRNEKNISYGLFCLSLSFWSLAYFLWQISANYNQAFFWCKVLMAFATFIPISYLHHIYSLLHETNKYRIRINLSYLFGAVSAYLCFTSLFIKGVSAKMIFKFWPDAGPLYFLFLSFWFLFVFLGIFSLVRALLKQNTLISKEQLRYVLIATIIGWTGGATNFPLWFDIKILPIGNILTSLYVSIVAYAIIKYRLMDIRLAISNTAIFIGVYAIVLGLPFYIYSLGTPLIALIIMLILATTGPFIYLFIQKRAEDRLLQEQRRYQATLRQASAGMGKIKDLNKLLNMIVYVLTNAIQIEHALIYIYNESQKQYILGASKRKSGYGQFIQDIQKDSPLIQYFLENKNLVIFEEIKQKAQDYKDVQLAKIEKIIASLEGALLVPIYIDQELSAFIIMGKKESGKAYTEDDLAVFGILANQTALAIENAIFYEQMKLTHEQLFQAEKMATIGTMADGLSHQINNRFHALGFIAGDALDTIHLNQKELTQDKMKEIMVELERAFVRVQDNVVQGGDIVQGLLKYTRKGEAGFAAIDIEAVLKSAIEMVQFKIKIHELKVERDYDASTIPKIKGNFTQLQEVFFNLIDNGYDAMMQRKNEMKEPGYQPILKVRVLKEDGYAQIIFEDNGMGVKDEDLYKLFTPFFTTKLSSKKGTGLGLYVIKKIVEDNHGGKVEMVSKYMQGTQMKLRLPIAIG